ncbi:unnamed protein product [Heterobilharzia americana]|nr:unnamed protein product [Heterobilharzia americana]CAH8450591.1 unnamed protein product [Heterobilharzia americana]
MNGFPGTGSFKVICRSLRSSLMSSNVFCASFVHPNLGLPSSLYKGAAISLKFLRNRLQNPALPKICHSFLFEFGTGMLLTVRISSGNGLISPFPTLCLSNVTRFLDI